MACHVMKLPGGGGAIICAGRGRAAARCQHPACNTPHVALCDHPLGNGKTCDMRLCGAHRIKVGPDDDRCEHHAEPLLELERIGVR